MKIALFDVEDQLVELARAAAQFKDHAITVVVEPGEHAAEVLRLFPAATLEANWESLLVAGRFDVLAVGRSIREIATREELLRRAVQEGVPLVCVQPAADAIVMHELAMIQRDTHSLLAVWNPSQQHPAAQRLLALAREKPISQIVWQRSLRKNSRPTVFAQLARDAALLQSLAGPLDRVTAAGSASAEKIASLVVTFSGSGEALTQWLLQPAAEQAGGKLSITAGGEQYQLEMPADDSAWILTQAPTAARLEEVRETIPLGEAMLRSIEELQTTDPSAPTITQTWKAACQAAELAEGAQQSLRRSRTIQLYFEEHSEEQSFKGVMAISGCLVLLLMLALVGLSVVIDASGLPVRNSAWWRLWPLYVLVPAVLLLAAQSLWRVFATKARTSTLGDANASRRDAESQRGEKKA